MRLSLVTRVFAGFFLVLCLLGGVALYSVVTMDRMQHEVDVVKQGLLPVAARLHNLSQELGQVAALVNNSSCGEVVWVAHFLPEMDPFGTLVEIGRELDTLAAHPHLSERSRNLFTNASMQIDALVQGNNLLRDLAAELAAAGTEVPHDSNPTIYHELTDRYLVTAAATPEDRAGKNRRIRETLRRATHLLRKRVKGLEAGCNLALNSAWASAQEREVDAVKVALYLGGAACIVVFAVLLLLLKWLRPLSTLRQMAQRIAAGDYSHPPPLYSGDEIGQLSQELAKMADRLKEREEMVRSQAQELVRADRFSTIGKMSTQIAHEIRNPLNALGLKLELLDDSVHEQKENLSPEAYTDFTKAVEASGKEIDRLREITDYYLKFARFPEVEKELVDLSMVVSDVVSFYQEEARQKGVSIEKETDRPLKARADPNLVRHALANLLKNAIEATSGGPEKGQIVVKSWRESKAIRLTVKDNGPGISADKVQRVFEPFFTTKRSGTGLGLTLVQQIVDEHGGTISCASAPGEGTTFKILIPE